MFAHSARPRMRQGGDDALTGGRSARIDRASFEYRLMERARETYIPTVQACPQAPARLPRAHGDEVRPSGSGTPPRERPQAAFGLIEAPADRLAVGRLTVRRQFLFVAQGLKAVRPATVVQARTRDRTGDCPDGEVRAGFTATKKVGGAVVRNRAKRRLKEAARALLPLHGVPGTDYVFVARHQTAARDWSLLLEDVKSALEQLAPALRGGQSGSSKTGLSADGR